MAVIPRERGLVPFSFLRTPRPPELHSASCAAFRRREIRSGRCRDCLPLAIAVTDRMTADPNNPEVLTRVRSDIEAAAIVAALTARGIKASTTGSYTAGFRAEAPGDVHVVVRHEDLSGAKQMLAEIEQDQIDVDWSQVDVGEPEEP